MSAWPKVKSYAPKPGMLGRRRVAIVVARRSGLNISMGKTGKDRKKEKENTRKKRDGIRTTELNRRGSGDGAKSGPDPRKTGAEVDNQVAAPLLNWKTHPCTERKSLNQE